MDQRTSVQLQLGQLVPGAVDINLSVSLTYPEAFTEVYEYVYGIWYLSDTGSLWKLSVHERHLSDLVWINACKMSLYAAFLWVWNFIQRKDRTQMED